MILIGVVLLIIGAGAGAVAFVGARGQTSRTELSAFGFSREVAPLEILIIGALAALLFCIGWAVVAASLRRRARRRREDRERERVAGIQREAEGARVDHERRFDEAGLRDEDFRRREDELDARHQSLDAREQEIARLESAYKEKVTPSVADVVTGRAAGRVSEGTAAWTDSPAPAEPGPDATRPLPSTESPHRDT